MRPITVAEATAWLEDYGRAWKAGDADGIVPLFSEDASYHETPFDPPMIGGEAIRQYWLEGASSAQRDVSFGFEVWATSDDQCFSHWWAAFTRVPSGERVEIDGTFRLVFERDSTGHPLCRKLQEWWHRR